jgi:hypothetical protein
MVNRVTERRAGSTTRSRLPKKVLISTASNVRSLNPDEAERLRLYIDGSKYADALVRPHKGRTALAGAAKSAVSRLLKTLSATYTKSERRPAVPKSYLRKPAARLQVPGQPEMLATLCRVDTVTDGTLRLQPLTAGDIAGMSESPPVPLTVAYLSEALLRQGGMYVPPATQRPAETISPAERNAHDQALRLICGAIAGAGGQITIPEIDLPAQHTRTLAYTHDAVNKTYTLRLVE